MTDTRAAGRIHWMTAGGLILVVLMGVAIATGEPTPLTWFLALVGLLLLGIGLIQRR